MTVGRPARAMAMPAAWCRIGGTIRPPGPKRRSRSGAALRLSLYTDFSLRLLLYLGAARPDGWATTPDIARTFGISAHHLHKAVQGLVRAGFVEAKQGRAGGVRLGREPAAIRLGAVVSALEGTGCLIDCGRGPCPLAGRCLIKHALDAAERGFIRELDRFTLADLLGGGTGTALGELIAADRTSRALPAP